MQKYYKITTDWTGTNYLGFTIKWNYQDGQVEISIPYYIKKNLLKFHHSFPKRFKYAIHKWTEPVYGKTRQYAIEKYTDLLIHADETKIVQQIVGNLLYYARAM